MDTSVDNSVDQHSHRHISEVDIEPKVGRDNVFEGLCFQDVDFGWSPTQNLLTDISFDFKPGERVAVVGKVGTGKTSLLLAILGEIPVNKGRVLHSGEFAYAE